MIILLLPLVLSAAVRVQRSIDRDLVQSILLTADWKTIFAPNATGSFNLVGELRGIKQIEAYLRQVPKLVLENHGLKVGRLEILNQVKSHRKWSMRHRLHYKSTVLDDLLKSDTALRRLNKKPEPQEIWSSWTLNEQDKVIDFQVSVNAVTLKSLQTLPPRHAMIRRICSAFNTNKGVCKVDVLQFPGSYKNQMQCINALTDSDSDILCQYLTTFLLPKKKVSACRELGSKARICKSSLRKINHSEL